jgi:uncharacterized membrane protein YdbT with pleckstrin-like domain
MGYIESNLLPDEHVVHRAHLHWVIFLRAATVLIVGLVTTVFVPVLGAAMALVGLLLLLPPYLKRRSSEYGVTTKRVIIKTGLVQRRTIELLLRQVEAISVDQSVIGRFLGYGTLTLTGTGGVKEVFHDIAAPLEFRRSIHGQTA